MIRGERVVVHVKEEVVSTGMRMNMALIFPNAKTETARVLDRLLCTQQSGVQIFRRHHYLLPLGLRRPPWGRPRPGIFLAAACIVLMAVEVMCGLRIILSPVFGIEVLGVRSVTALLATEDPSLVWHQLVQER